MATFSKTLAVAAEVMSGAVKSTVTSSVAACAAGTPKELVTLAVTVLKPSLSCATSAAGTETLNTLG